MYSFVQSQSINTQTKHRYKEEDVRVWKRK
jgi:hypothetical protein